MLSGTGPREAHWRAPPDVVAHGPGLCRLLAQSERAAARADVGLLRETGELGRAGAPSSTPRLQRMRGSQDGTMAASGRSSILARARGAVLAGRQ
jgi:hypothetical protein